MTMSVAVLGGIAGGWLFGPLGSLAGTVLGAVAGWLLDRKRRR